MQVHLILLLLVLFLNLISKRFIDRKKYILPISFLIIGLYLAIRYNYGSDYFSYMNFFYADIQQIQFGTGEFLFFNLMSLFDKYYIFIIFHTIVLMSTLFYIVRKYINDKYYILFFFIFMCTAGMMFNMISALRSTLAACVLCWGFEFFYFKKKRILLFYLIVVIAAFFHTSSLAFFIVPIFDFIYKKTNYKFLFLLLCVSLISSMFYTNILFRFFTSTINIFGDYSVYNDKSTTFGSNINGVILKSLYLFPSFFILKHLKNQKGVKYYVGMLSVLFLFISLIGLDFEGRFTSYLFIYVIIALSFTLSLENNKLNKIFCVTPIVIVTIYGLYYMYFSMYLYRFSSYYEGNFLWYQTIFSIPQLP